jgi:predicted O-methyltransferase YrrM
MSPRDPAIWAKVDDYFDALLVPLDEMLEAAVEASHQAGLPPIAVTSLQGKFLEFLIRISGSHRILEIGTLGGYSTMWMARALPNEGRIITLELESHHARVANENLRRAGLLHRVDIRVCPANQSLAALVAERAEPFDLIFIDADKQGYPEYLEGSLKLSRIGTVIVADNVVREGKVIDPKSKDENIHGVRRFTELMAANPRLSGTVLQTVGSKGYDGFALARVLS